MRSPKICFTELNQVSSQRLGNFSFLQSQVANWQKLTQIIQSHLPPQGQWQVVYYQNGLLTITGDNQALISQVRYLHNQFIQKFKTIPSLEGLERIQVILKTPDKPTSKKYTRSKTLSNETQQALRQAASLVNDAKLSQALLRLASPDNIKVE
ncbi:DUF721 domain-containing protein [Acinetobacter qingfengensis]|uniref:Uncharacterized protein n=1 Tax=Acinetobacter qingfengensis TaxID=1262585 RepID=A0A1E7QWK7_9GAMM|nr:hypothetical protein [Acinetobacter qingfengensis]KAA8731335.1 DUF721 domain-containing protein [Acinetobacter qingfengensis]OEY91463.1 hypothetical protein BJI46_06935 [Acinetobacter qingfengensis]